MRTRIHVVGPTDLTESITALFASEAFPGDLLIQYVEYGDWDVYQVTATVGEMTDEEQSKDQQLKVDTLNQIGLALVQLIPNANVTVRDDRHELPAFKSKYSPQDAAA